LIGISFDERDAARAGISNLTGETVRTKATCEEEEAWWRGQPVDHEWGRMRYRWASGACSVQLPVPGPAARTEITEQREARCFMVSPLGCLVQFTHWEGTQPGPLASWSQSGLVPSMRLLAQVIKAAWGEVECSALWKLRVSPKRSRSVRKKNKTTTSQADDSMDGPTRPLLASVFYW